MIPVEQKCIQCGNWHFGSDMVELFPCAECMIANTANVDYTGIETRIAAHYILDIFGTESAAKDSIVKALAAEKSFWEITLEQKEEFVSWAFLRAALYEDGSTVDWIGAFYDWKDEWKNQTT